ncbi:MAG: DUF4168 domain-containing protein [Leptolyngbyaceae cyanobacterium]
MKNSSVNRQTTAYYRTLNFFAVGAMSGWLAIAGLPTVSPAGVSMLPLAAIAQTDISNTEISQYARAALAIDQYRNTAYAEVKSLLTEVNMDISEINVGCTDTRDLSNVPRSVRGKVSDILSRYCNQSRQAVEDNNLTPTRFNEITKIHEENTTVYERIQQELIRLQQDEQ